MKLIIAKLLICIFLIIGTLLGVHGNSQGAQDMNRKISAQITFSLKDKHLMLSGEIAGENIHSDRLFDIPVKSRVTSEMVKEKCKLIWNDLWVYFPKGLLDEPNRFISLDSDKLFFKPSIIISTPKINLKELEVGPNNLIQEYNTISAGFALEMEEKKQLSESINFKGSFGYPWYQSGTSELFAPFDKVHFSFGFIVPDSTRLDFNIIPPKGYTVKIKEMQVEENVIPRGESRPARSSTIESIVSINEDLEKDQILWISGFLEREKRNTVLLLLAIGIFATFCFGLFKQQSLGVFSSVLIPILISLVSFGLFSGLAFIGAGIILMILSFLVGLLIGSAKLGAAIILFLGIVFLVIGALAGINHSPEPIEMQKVFGFEKVSRFLTTPEPLASDLKLAVELMNAGRYEQAEKGLMALYEEWDHPEVIIPLAHIEFNLGKLDESLTLYKKAYECLLDHTHNGPIRKNLFDCMLNIANVLWAQAIEAKKLGTPDGYAKFKEKADEALEYCQKAKDLNSKNERLYITMADLQFLRGDIRSLVSILEEAWFDQDITTKTIKEKLISAYQLVMNISESKEKDFYKSKRDKVIRMPTKHWDDEQVIFEDRNPPSVSTTPLQIKLLFPHQKNWGTDT